MILRRKYLLITPGAKKPTLDQAVLPGYTAKMKTAVSIPDDVFAKVEALAAKLGKSRSELITDALREHVRAHGDAAITARLDVVYAEGFFDQEDRTLLDLHLAETAKRNEW